MNDTKARNMKIKFVSPEPSESFLRTKSLATKSLISIGVVTNKMHNHTGVLNFADKYAITPTIAIVKKKAKKGR